MTGCKCCFASIRLKHGILDLHITQCCWCPSRQNSAAISACFEESRYLGQQTRSLLHRITCPPCCCGCACRLPRSSTKSDFDVDENFRKCGRTGTRRHENLSLIVHLHVVSRFEFWLSTTSLCCSDEAKNIYYAKMKIGMTDQANKSVQNSAFLSIELKLRGAALPIVSKTTK